jgi:hypothetical protein
MTSGFDELKWAFSLLGWAIGDLGDVNAGSTGDAVANGDVNDM